MSYRSYVARVNEEGDTITLPSKKPYASSEHGAADAIADGVIYDPGIYVIANPDLTLLAHVFRVVEQPTLRVVAL